MPKNIPFFTLFVDDNVEGMDFMGLVDSPAHMKGYQTFASGKSKPKKIKDKFDEEKRTVTGVAVAVDLPIYRNDSEIGPHYVVFKKDETEKMWVKMMQKNYLHNVNNMHDMDEPVEGISMSFCYQVDKDGGLYPEMFADQNLKDGSIVVSYKAHTDEAWDYIKKNNGFSIEGWFAKQPLKIKGEFSTQKFVFATISEVNIWDMEVIEEDIELGTELHHKWINEDGSFQDGGRVRAGEYITPDKRTLQVDSRGVVVMIDGKSQEQMTIQKQSKKSTKMKKNKRGSVMSRMFGKDKFASVTTVDGIEIFWEGDLAEGVEITINDENGESILAPEGDHTFENEDGTMTVVTVDGNGVVTALTTTEPEEGGDDEAMTAEAVEALLKKLRQETDNKLKAQKTEFDKEIKGIKETHAKELKESEEKLKQLAQEIDDLEDGGKKKFNRKSGKDKKVADWKNHC